MTAAVGMAVGGRAWLLALMTTLLGWVILAVLRLFESRKQAEDSQTEVDSPLKVPPPEEPDED